MCDKSPFPLGEGWGEGVSLLTQELQMPLKTATYSEKWICHTPSNRGDAELLYRWSLALQGTSGVLGIPEV